MKPFKTPVFLSLSIALCASSLTAAGARSGEVVYEEPDGAVIARGDTSLNLAAGLQLVELDIIKSNDSTVIIAICDGSLITIYPATEVEVLRVDETKVELKLIKGEILGDTLPGCEVAVGTKVGTVNISNGVYGVLMNETGDGWTLQVRNLDGTVSITGDPKLDTSKMTVSLIEPNKTFDIPAGDEVVVRGIYNPDTEIFSIVPGGASVAMMSDDTMGQLRNEAATMSSIGLPAGEETVTPPEEQPGKPTKVIIEIPWMEVETASDKG